MFAFETRYIQRTEGLALMKLVTSSSSDAFHRFRGGGDLAAAKTKKFTAVGHAILRQSPFVQNGLNCSAILAFPYFRSNGQFHKSNKSRRTDVKGASHTEVLSAFSNPK